MKTFYIIQQVALNEVASDGVVGTVQDARKALESAAFEDGKYLILEDTSGEVTKKTETVQKSSVTFSVPTARKRGPRKAKE